MDDINQIKKDLAQVSRLALSEQFEDVRLFVARLVRKYRNLDPEFASELDLFLKRRTTKSHGPLRRADRQEINQQILPVDDDSRLSLLRVFNDTSSIEHPLMSGRLEDQLGQIIQERKHSNRLKKIGLQPTASAIFVGAPGVGKTLCARWLAAQLNLPLFALDLATVMSSFLGRSGSNLRSALDYARRTPCILLLDEIDAIAKRRSDDADIGELKRLVTVMLQEVEDWQASGLLLAATNHPELIDPALWRRFDMIVEFDMPDEKLTLDAVRRFLGPETPLFDQWSEVLSFICKGQSFSDIERSIKQFRRAHALDTSSDSTTIEDLVRKNITELGHKDRIEIAKSLSGTSKFSQHSIHRLTGVSRDTIRKNTKKISTRRREVGA